jgi:predicted DsbA family dithiol-disulfide isomerase
VVTWLESIKEDVGKGLSIKWKAFSLEQQNNQKGPDFKIWEHPDYPSLGLPALVAAKAAENQGEGAFIKFHLAVFEARHGLGKNIRKPEVLKEIAGEVNLDPGPFEKDCEDPKTREAVGKDHMEARKKYNIFGVPTLIFDDKKPVYIKIEAVPQSKKERISLFESIYKMAVIQPYLIEVKRPDPILL